METGAHRRWRWLADDGILPRNVRLSFELLGVIALPAAYVATGSELAQALVLFGLLLVVLPVARRIFQPTEPDEHWQEARRHAYPAGVFAPAVLAMLVMVAVWSVILDMAPGRWFWTFLFLALSFEFQDLLARRQFRIRGNAGWDDIPPLSHSGLAAVVTVLLVLPLAVLFDGDALLDAAVWALACGMGVFLLGAVFTVIIPRTGRPPTVRADAGKARGGRGASRLFSGRDVGCGAPRLPSPWSHHG